MQHLCGVRKWRQPTADRLWLSLCVSVTLSVKDKRRGSQKYSCSPRPQIRILNERGMFGNRLVERERESERGGKTSKKEDARIFFPCRQRCLLKLALVWLGVKVEEKNACGIGIRLMSDKKRGVVVI